ncbi:SUKH-3 domain-containing protein [Streptomyces boninensis]|uniref:SUKH-3 domain-containing protein n=1 Tax=Streptomyces boninensis TaxID=2039455 RepID=UPI003B22712B
MQQSGSGQRWSADTDQVLREAGWHPGRYVPTAEWERALQEHDEFEIHPAAQRFLAEFGGLYIPDRGAGITMGRAEIDLNPALARWDREIYDALRELAGVELYPLGMTDRRNWYLGMTPTGAVYIGRDDVLLLAEDGDRALEKIIQGIK